ncbi:hypothetical protein SAMN04488047_14130 [Tranquillimonas alkanivorans]|uniref:Uncharacterized protein n=2 Tax=Tranquillimonas alkanivorans TaxID=441119 RepID=A0A1I5W8L4_9RHOB|nr:hypothetical protein SAMN04488047_14130 [Tranquillimonas alkanivorans]
MPPVELPKHNRTDGMTGDTSLILTVGVAVLLAAVHVFSPHLRFLDRRPRSIWLSIAGGVSVAYVFVHLLPELAHLQREHGEAAPIEGLLYLFALVGLVVFYGLERMAKAMAGGRTRASPPGAFWLHLGSFALYNVLIGYLLDEQAREEGTAGMILYGVAMGLHFVVNDRDGVVAVLPRRHRDVPRSCC